MNVGVLLLVYISVLLIQVSEAADIAKLQGVELGTHQDNKASASALVRVHACNFAISEAQ